ncbi:MAG: PQQ-binding-like beta-propeller repeat protein [Alphaproteobacteria bacterium]|nr:PQQ-binding-like beta-propeller repeat protein [Alphaproteobacteria bacterium]
MKYASIPLLALALTACSYMPDWMGAEKDEPPLPGKRISVLAQDGNIVADPALTQAVTLPPSEAKAEWPQVGGAASNYVGRVSWGGNPGNIQESEAGEGREWETRMAAQPVVADRKVFAMDGAGVISAHDAADIGRVLWKTPLAKKDDQQDMLAGGLVFGEGRLFASAGFGDVIGIDPATGKELWRRSLGVPLRAAPKIAEAKLFVVSKDNQIFALSPQDGRVMWKAAGLGEIAGFIGAASPAIEEGIIVTPYSSGEIYGLTTATGRQLWQENIGNRRGTGSAVLYDISGNPVIEGGVVYAVSSNGSLSALNLRTGERRWEQKIASIQTPWLAGDYLFVLSVNNTLACVQKLDGRIRWVAQLPSFADPEKQKEPLIWSGPVLAGDYVLMTGAHGKLVLLSPVDGRLVREVSIPDGITRAPVTAGGVLYAVTRKGRLVAIR